MEIKINLIPPYIKREILESRRLELVLSLGIRIFVVLAVFFLFLFGLYKVLEINLSVVSDFQKRSDDFEKYEKIKEFDAEFEKINNNTRDVLAIKDDQLYWSNIFLELSSSLVPGIAVENLKNNDYLVTVSGVAKDRDTLIAYKGKLEANECFSKVDLPLSNLVSKNDIDFQIDFEIKEECLKTKR